MISGLLLVATSAVLGGFLALAARRRPILLELTRTFAFAAAFGVVGFHLVPEILPTLGFEALIWIAAGFALPWILEAGARVLGPGFLARRGMHGLRVAAEVAFIALVFHSVVEGMALLAVVQSSERATDIQLAILAHHAPLTAAVALPFLELRGARSAAVRVAIVGLSGVAGIILGNAVPGLASGTDAGLVQRATAMTAGALLHVVSDEIREQRFQTRWERLSDILAGVLGLGLAGLGAFFDLRNEASVVAVVRASVSLALSVAPALLVGLAFRWATLRFAPRAAEPARAAAAGVFPLLALLGVVAAAVRVVLGALFWSLGRRLAALRRLAFPRRLRPGERVGSNPRRGRAGPSWAAGESRHSLSCAGEPPGGPHDARTGSGNRSRRGGGCARCVRGAFADRSSRSRPPVGGSVLRGLPGSGGGAARVRAGADGVPRFRRAPWACDDLSQRRAGVVLAAAPSRLAHRPPRGLCGDRRGDALAVHSALSAITGSTRAATRAGIQQAMSAAKLSTAEVVK